MHIAPVCSLTCPNASCAGQDKWRNLNMEAREQAFEQLQPDDDPDFRVRQLTSHTSATFCLLACLL